MAAPLNRLRPALELRPSARGSMHSVESRSFLREPHLDTALGQCQCPQRYDERRRQDRNELRFADRKGCVSPTVLACDQKKEYRCQYCWRNTAFSICESKR